MPEEPIEPSDILQEPRSILEQITILFLILKAFFLMMFRRLLPDRPLREGVRGKAVLITGCDSGFGHATAQCLDALGFKVFAGCLDVRGSGSMMLEKVCSNRLTTLQLDITKQEDLDQARHEVEKLLGAGDLWGLVNNAGVCYLGNTEIMTWEDTSRMIDVNLKGTVRSIKTFLPLIRRSKGRIVNIGSVNGEVPMQNFAVYNGSKAAIRAYTETLRYEMKKWGVSVSLLAPAGFKTEILSNMAGNAERWWEAADGKVKKDYGRQYFNMTMRPSERIKVSSDLSPVTQAISHALGSARPKAVYRVGLGSRILPIISTYTPAAFADWFCTNMLDFCVDLPQMLKDERY